MVHAEISRESDRPMVWRIHSATDERNNPTGFMRRVFVLLLSLQRNQHPEQNRVGKMRLDVELCAPPVAAFCVVLQYAYSNLESHVEIPKIRTTHLNFSIRLQTKPLGNGSMTQIVNKSSQIDIVGVRIHRFWRDALARMRFVRKDFWEG